MTRGEEWRAPVISAALLTFLALTPLISHRTARLAAQGGLLLGMVFHIYKDGKRPFFIGKINAIGDCPRLYGTGASNPLGQITDANGEAIGRKPLETLFMACFDEVKCRRNWCGMRQAALPTNTFDLPYTLMHQAKTDGELLFRYGGVLVQVVPTEDLIKTFNNLSKSSRLPEKSDIPEGWAYFSSETNDYLLSTDPVGWTLAEGWRRLTTDSEGNLVEASDQTVPDFFRPHLAARKPVSTSFSRLGYEPFRNVKKELSLDPERVEILERRGRLFLLSEKEGQAYCRIISPEGGVSLQDLRFSGTTVKVFDSRPVEGADKSPVTTDRERWTLTNGWQSLQVGIDGRLAPAPEQTLPPYFRNHSLHLRYSSNPTTITPTRQTHIATQGLLRTDGPTLQILAKERVLHLVCTARMPGYDQSGKATTISMPFHHLIHLSDGMTLENLQFALANGQITIQGETI